MPLAIFALILATAFPSSSKTSWMSPQSFRLTIGMKRADAISTLQGGGWDVKKGPVEHQAVIDYSDDKALTLEFRRDRLHSVRFELFATLQEIRAAFLEQRLLLQKQHGEAKKTSKIRSVVIYDDRLPNIMVVLSDDPQSEYGRKGIGFLVVRYYDPTEIQAVGP